MNTTLKILVIGEFGGGKSSMIIQYTCGHFIVNYDPTLDDDFRKQVMVDDICVYLDILDYSGSDEFTAMRDLYIRNADGFIIVHPINLTGLNEDVEKWYDMIYQIQDKSYDEHIPMIIVGTKSDLENERQTSKQEAEDLSNIKYIPYLECSAKTNDNISVIFEAIARDVLETKEGKNQDERKPKQKGCIVI